MDPSIEMRVGRAVAERWPDAEVVQQRMLDGRSGLTVRADLVGADAPDRVVAKLCPEGRPALGRHDVVRQTSITQDLADGPGLPVPRVLHTTDLEGPVAIVEFVEGEAAEPVLDLAPGERPVEVLQARARGAAALLARLHAVDPASLPSARGETPRSVVDELETWVPTMGKVPTELVDGADDLAAALRASVPAAVAPALVHGDFRLGNLMCRDADILAIVDWEIWSVGDPRIDLGWMFIMSSPLDTPGVVTSTDGLLPVPELVEIYEQAAGRPVPDLGWFHALARFKMAAIMGHNLHRHRSGRRVDPYQERLVDTIPALIRSGLAAL